MHWAPAIAGAFLFIVQTCFLRHLHNKKVQSWEEVIKKPKKEKFLKGLSVKQDLQATKKSQALSLLLKKKVDKLAGLISVWVSFSSFFNLSTFRLFAVRGLTVLFSILRSPAKYIVSCHAGGSGGPARIQ